MNEIQFNAKNIQSIRPPIDGFETYHDTKEQSLCLYVTKNSQKSFFVRKKVNGAYKRVVLGSFPDMTVQMARDAALNARLNNATTEISTSPGQTNMTFGDGFRHFMERYSRLCKKSWQDDEYEVPRFMKHWFNRRLSSITKREVHELHEKIGRENGKVTANRILEKIKAIYNKLIEWDLHDTNPAKTVKKFREKARDRFIMIEEFPRFMAALREEKHQSTQDFFMLCLLTAARKSNVCEMRWENISLKLQMWHIPDTKNGEPVNVPLIPQSLDILSRRWSEQGCPLSGWVFPSEISMSGHGTVLKSAWRRIVKRAEINDLRVHDLRRTMGSYQAILGSSLSVIGKSLGHKSLESTQIYARLTNDAVRESMTKAALAMKGFCHE